MTENDIQAANQAEEGGPPHGWIEPLGTDLPSIQISELLHELKKNKTRVLQITLAVFLVVTVGAFLLPNEYTSSASFIPPSGGSSSAATALAGQISAMSGGNLLGGIKNSGDLYAGILRSRSIADRLVERFDLMKAYRVARKSDAVKRLGSNTTIDVGQKDSIVTVSVRDRSPERARDIANGYLDVLREKNGLLALSESSQRRLFFAQQLAKEKDDLENAEVELEKTEEQSGLIAPAGQTTIEIQTIPQTRAEIAVRQVQLAALRQSSTEQNPEVIRLQSEIADLQGQLSRLQKGSKERDTASIPTSRVPELQLEYVRKEREVKYHEALFDMLAKQYEGARIDEARDAPLLQVLDPASYPDAKSSPHRSLIMLGGFIFGILAGSGWVLGQKAYQEMFPTATTQAVE